jgi:hypothetical protein
VALRKAIFAKALDLGKEASVNSRGSHARASRSRCGRSLRVRLCDAMRPSRDATGQPRWQ